MTFVPAGLNSNVVTLIHKFRGDSKVEDFRPIVLGNFLFKVFTKIISIKLGPLLNRILSPSQYGFIPGRKIQHCIAICSEGVQCINKCPGSMALKIDIKKAFDTMKWDFLLSVLECLGFKQHFRDLISSILNSARLSISINGRLEGFFSCSRGVRQGDPLSPLLFAIGEEVLAKMMDYRGGIRSIAPIEAKLGILVPTTLLYADDVMIFCKATHENVLLIRDIFSQYGISSDQVINPSKSRVFFGKQVSGVFRHYFSNALHFVEGSIPFDYLGVPIFFGMPKMLHLRSLANKILLKFDR